MVSVLYVLESVFFAVYLIVMEVPAYLIQEREDIIYKELLLFFSRVKHRYTTGRNIANAIVDGADGMIYEVRRMAEELYYVLMECDRKENIREFISNGNTNRFVNMFFIQAYEASEKGDTYFAENIEHLRYELMEEIYRRKKRRHEFSGYVFVAVVPFFLMPVLKYWGLEFAPELAVFYSGTGMLLETVTFIVSFLVYRMISGAKETVLIGKRVTDKLWQPTAVYRVPWIKAVIGRMEKANGHFSKDVRTLILRSGERTSYGRICFQMLLIIISAWIVLTVFFLEKQNREQSTILTNVESIEMIAPIAGKEKQMLLAEHILEVTKQCLKRKETEEEEIRNLLRNRIRLENESMEQKSIEEIQKKLEKYRKTKLLAGEAVLGILGSLIIGFYPVFKLYYQAKTIYAGADYEVRQMQSVILMERKIKGITVIGLLEDMEVFAGSFQKCLRRCINSYGMGTREALLRLKEEGRQIHASFEELADAFLSVDEVGIELAFEEIESSRRLLEKLAQLEADINMEKKKDSTDLLARIPAVLTVGGYFIAPFFLYSLQGVFEVFELLENLQM